MREILESSIEFYAMLEYFTTRNENDTSGMPTIPLKPFNDLESVNKTVIKKINENVLKDTNIKCISLSKR